MTNCPPVYRNLQCENFGNKRKITSQMLRQFCKNDAYLYEQVMALWDTTDPESRKRFYPPDFMDVAHSFGIESYVLATNDEREAFNYWSDVYRFSRTTRFEYVFDFDGSNDRIEQYMDGDIYCTRTYADSFLDVENTHNAQMLEIVNENGSTTVRPHITTSTYKEIIHHNATYSTKKSNTSSKYVTEKTEKLGKAKKDAHFYGAFNNWDCNNHWYNGFNRTKNYNIKSKWRKNPDSYDIPSVCHAQTFKALNSGRLSKVNLNVQGDKSAVSPCIVEIRETSAKGYPTQKVLARTEKKFSGKGENIVAFEFKTKAKITKGETYAIVVRSPLSTFANCYRLGGWTVGCFSSESKYYGNGSAFTSEDNGKTWKKNGKTKDTKSYGSHYYDWGINQKPVDFAFEVFVQPITTEAKKKKVTSSNAKKLIEQGYTLQKDGTYRKLLKKAYDETHTYEYSYIKEGSYYLHLKPIQVNPIDNITITNSYTLNDGDDYWKWEYYDVRESQWKEVQGGYIEYDNNTTNRTVVKLRVRCDIERNTYVDTTSTISDSTLNSLINSNKLSRTVLTYLKGTTIRIITKKPTKAYLRTLYYHPPQDQILGANIWSEVGVNAQTIGDATVEVDIIHENVATDHFKFYDLNILNGANMNSLTVQQSELVELMGMHINAYENRDSSTYIEYSASAIIDYVYNDKTSNDGLFISYLKNLLTPVYILPLYYNNATEPIFFFDKLMLHHLPSYPLNGSEIGDDDIIIDTNKFTGKSEHGFYYPLDKSIEKTLSSIDVTYKTKLDINLAENEVVTDEDGFEANESDIEEGIEETLKGIILDKQLSACLDNGFVNSNVFPIDVRNDNDVLAYSSIDYALTKDGRYVIFSAKSKMINTIFPNLASNYDFANKTSLSSSTDVGDFELKINLTTKSYQEFVDFEVDYDEGTIEFYNQLSLIHGDFNITYNPLWVRGLSVADFPLKMDLWKEHYRVGTKDGADGIYKLKYNLNDNNYVEDNFYGQTRVNPYTNSIDLQGRNFYTFKTTVAPRDNIRKLVVNEGTTDERVLVEDSQFFVDYLANKIVFYISDLSYGDTITIHYTPNLTDNGLALGYRIKRGRYIVSTVNGETSYVQSTDDDLQAQPLDIHDVYIGMNYFTYRT